MPLLIVLAAFGFGFATCLVLMGQAEKKYISRIQELETENQELKIKYLNNCWNS